VIERKPRERSDLNSTETFAQAFLHTLEKNLLHSSQSLFLPVSNSSPDEAFARKKNGAADVRRRKFFREKMKSVAIYALYFSPTKHGNAKPLV
jgi:hypothetical protein